MIVVGVVGFAIGAGIAIADHVRAPEPAPTAAPAEPARTTDAKASPAGTTGDVSVAPIVPAEGEPLVQVTDPRVLAEWDADAKSPLSLASVLARLDGSLATASPGTPTTGALLGRASAGWQGIARTLEADLARIVDELAIDWETDILRTYDPSAAKTAIGRTRDHRGNGNVARVFDARWLAAERSRWSLAAVVYRPDRRDFVPGTCGEVRLVYRLAYELEADGRTYASRLPFTVNAVMHVPDDGEKCRRVAARWRAPAITDDNATAVARTLLAGPLADLRAAQLELDAQIVRFPSDLEHVEGRGFAGQALYWMRIFAMQDGALVPIGLENTPDVRAIRADSRKREALLAWITAELPAIDTGVFQLPSELQAKVALSWSTLGSARTANRPFSAIIAPSEVDAMARRLADGVETFVLDGATLLERLDGASCSGCHQSSSIAGFHLLGVERPFGTDEAALRAATDGNRLQLASSPHFAAEQPRRLAYLAELEAGREPDHTRPHPSAPAAHWDPFGPRHAPAGVNQPCVQGEALPNPTQWSCAEGTTCRVLAQESGPGFRLGQCVPDEAEVRAGLSCRTATIEPAPLPSAALLAWNVRAFADRVVQEQELYAIGSGSLDASAYNCRPAKIGVPLGRVTRNCRADERTLSAFAAASPAEICAIVGGKGFEQMAMGQFDSLAFAKGVGRGMLDTCDATRPCREDYSCQQLPDFLAQPHGPVAPALLADVQARGLGFCTPTYFVYQLRLDGHPPPL